jgi:drug/metabolite transporter (DMT)-like permease
MTDLTLEKDVEILQTTPPKTTDWTSWLLLLSLAATWGFAFLLMKHSLTLFHYTEVGLARIGISAICLLPVLIARRKEIPHDRWKYAFAVALTGSTIPALLYPLALTHTNSSLAGILNSMTPLWVLVLGALIFGVSLTMKRASGILVGLSGAAVLVLFKQKTGANNADNNNLYGLFIVAATMLYGFSGNVIGRYMQGVSAIIASAMGLVMVGIPALVYLCIFTNVPNMMLAMPPSEGDSIYNNIPPFFYMVILALVNTVFGSIAYVKLIQRTNPVFASLVTYIIPIFSIFFGILDGESLSFVQFCGMGLILSGVYLVNSKG